MFFFTKTFIDKGMYVVNIGEPEIGLDKGVDHQGLQARLSYSSDKKCSLPPQLYSNSYKENIWDVYFLLIEYVLNYQDKVSDDHYQGHHPMVGGGGS